MRHKGISHPFPDFLAPPHKKVPCKCYSAVVSKMHLGNLGNVYLFLVRGSDLSISKFWANSSRDLEGQHEN